MFTALVVAVVCCIGGLIWLFRPTVSPLTFPGILALVGVPLVVVSVISFLISGGPLLHMIFGSQFEFGTVGSFVLIMLVIYVASLVPRAWGTIVVVAFMACVAAINSIAVIALFFYPSLFTDVSFFPSWQTIALCAAATFVSAVCVYEFPLRRYSLMLVALGSVSLLVLALFPHQGVLLAALMSLVLIVPVKMLYMERESVKRFAAVAVCAGLFLVGCMFLPMVRPLPGDVRPSFSLSQSIVGVLYTYNPTAFFVGNGPHTFEIVWDRYHPREVNTTPYWNSTPTTAYSSIISLAAMVGLLGVAAFLLIPFVLLGVLFARGRVYNESIRSALTPLWAALAIAVVFFDAAIFYIVPLNLLLVAAVAIGFSVQFLYWAPPIPTKRHGVFKRLLYSIPIYALSAVLIWVSYYQISAARLYAAGMLSLAQGDPAAEVKLQQAAETWRYSVYERDAARAYLAVALNKSKNGLSENELIKSLSQMRFYAQRANNSNPNDFSTILSNASLLVSVVIAGAVEAHDEASALIVRSQGLSPVRPEPYRLAAELAYKMGDFSAARISVDKALLLKPDYKEALVLKKALDAILP